MFALLALAGGATAQAENKLAFPPLGHADTWKRLPAATVGAGGPLPEWARSLAGPLPKTTAALLPLRYAHRAAAAAPALSLAAEVIRGHHERWDYAGYPDGLAETGCPLSARVVGLASAYDALRSRRSYRPALTHARVVRMLMSELSGQFDPTLVSAFTAAAGRFETIFKMSPD